MITELTLLAPGTKERAKLDKLRTQIDEVGGEIEATREAPLPLESAVQRALAEIRELAGQPAHQLAAFAQPGAALVADPDDPAGARVRSPLERLSIPLLFNLAPELVEKGLRAHLAPHCESGGLPPADRRARIRELEQRIEKLLADEEAETLRLEDEGFAIDRRIPQTDADVERLLEVWEGL